jgi:hypothetical protein
MLAFSPAALAELAPRVSHGSILTWRQPRPGEEASGIVEPQGDGL